MNSHINEVLDILELRLKLINSDICKEKERLRKFTEWLIKETEREHKGLTDVQMLEKKKYVIKFRAYNVKCAQSGRTSLIHCFVSHLRKNKLIKDTKDYKHYLNLHTLETEKLIGLHKTLQSENFYSPVLDDLVHKKFETQEEIRELTRRFI